MGAETTAMKTLLILIGALTAAYGFDEEAKETIRKNYPAAKHLEVDNVQGFIHVTGYNGSEIQVVAEKRIVADSKDRLEAAQKDVKLDISQSGDTLTMYVDGPFRCNCGDNGRGIREHGRRGYRVIYDFEIKVPVATAVHLYTVNEGDIRLENTTGDFELSNVNRPIEAKEVGGSGKIHTVNGGITALFTKNPAANCSFVTVNGTIETSFQPGLNADVRVKTFNGRAYTDYEVTSLPRMAPVNERRDGKFVYRSDDFTGMRIGNGGPQFKYDTLNGSIRIINRGK
jgi:hypothetical protein